ncbi:unnamed protein product [Pseudo-nitzschia multistriata]|uniref:Ubiquitin-like domain-containing protein n=1 Tax=Pseudo-nitzschia multistriata TaxID=183589 RepID=A0A448YZF6_9STRA|nr:unnamed protein product [Pseudo-nitzschia multistriata]
MKIGSSLKFCTGAVVALLLGGASAAPPTPVSNVHVTLKGKKYQIDDVTTLAELQERLEEHSGIPPSKQGKILHNGKRLSESDDGLSEAGVQEGDQLNCVPAKKSSSKKKSASTTSAPDSSASPSEGGSADSLADMMKGLEGSMGGGAGGLDDMMSKLMSGGMGGGAGGMPDMAESMKMMKELTDSPMFAEYMNDPAKLEESRQMILNNPMMKAMMASMPGMSEILEDKDAWAQTMMAAAGIMKSMDPEDMMKMMEAGGAPGGGMPPGMGMPGGMGGGLFDGGASSALDELSEDDE